MNAPHPLGSGIAILGSCVSRDAVEFVAGLQDVHYFARQSIASMVSPTPTPALLAGLTLAPGIVPFHKRCIEEDVTKTALPQLAALPPDIPIMIDLIEERVPLGRLRDGTIVTLSEVATSRSNLRELVAEEIAPWSDEQMGLLRAAMPRLAAALEGRTIIIHRAFYAKLRRDFSEINAALASLYDDLARAFPRALVIEAPTDVRLSEPNHRWKPGPYHYIDAYYHAIVREMGQVLDASLEIKPTYTLRLPATA